MIIPTLTLNWILVKFYNLEFINKRSVFINEVYLILKDKVRDIGNLQSNSIFNKTMNYVERFNKFGIYDSQEKAIAKIREVRKYLNF